MLRLLDPDNFKKHENFGEFSLFLDILWLLVTYI